MKRRGFLKVAGAAGAAFGLAPASAANWFFSDRLPTLHGDGVHDDTEALQARIDRASETGEQVRIRGGTFKVSETLEVPADTDFLLQHCTLKAEGVNGPVVHVEPSGRIGAGSLRIDTGDYPDALEATVA